MEVAISRYSHERSVYRLKLKYFVRFTLHAVAFDILESGPYWFGELLLSSSTGRRYLPDVAE
ncbi:hypothetical protein D3Y57_05060 (plasmid) [Sphingomonas paeninsulae]|uniref:Uncharacterized protein n=1 Tax=Sphingomonas paeninsulae TaxID=2319844 RepID=A0A494THT6_SPHPE|nr:hypothetical protein D3Y57_05060 [Sphingomonas paeninsulae]